MGTYYDGTRLLSLKDINGDDPEIYMCTTNRTGGKTTYFSRWLVNRWLKNKELFGLLYRYNYELDNVANKFFSDIQGLFFPNIYMYSKRMCSGIFHELYIKSIYAPEDEEGELCGYAIAINSADTIKKYSHLFSTITRLFFDEFQSETNRYVPKEIDKFISIHTSIARGNGKQYRPVPVYMCSNGVSLINPYYVTLGISTRLRENTKFLRGDGFVLENGYVDSASKAQKEGAFNRAFSKSHYVAYSSENIYLNDCKSFIEKPSGFSRYLATIKYNNAEYAIREYEQSGILYCDNSPDVTYKYKIAVDTDSHDINYVMLKRNDMFIQNMRYFFERGCFRFKNLLCKECVMKLISY